MPAALEAQTIPVSRWVRYNATYTSTITPGDGPLFGGGHSTHWLWIPCVRDDNGTPMPPFGVTVTSTQRALATLLDENNGVVGRREAPARGTSESIHVTCERGRDYAYKLAVSLADNPSGDIQVVMRFVGNVVTQSGPNFHPSAAQTDPTRVLNAMRTYAIAHPAPVSAPPAAPVAASPVLNVPTAFGGTSHIPAQVGPPYPIPIAQLAANTSRARTLAAPMEYWSYFCRPSGPAVQVDINSTWDNLAFLLDPSGKRITLDDNGGGGTNARVRIPCAEPGLWRMWRRRGAAARSGRTPSR